MGLLEDLFRAGDRLRVWSEKAATATTEWADSERGQQVLTAVDFVSISSRVGDFYTQHGWYLPTHPALHRFVLEHAEYHIPFDPRRGAALIGPASQHWPWIVEGIGRSPSLDPRRPLVDDAIFCLEHERWHAAVCTLLPVIEGVVSDKAGVVDGMRVGRRFGEIIHNQTADHWETLSAVLALRVLDAEVFTFRDFKTVGLAEEALNRHLVLHGRTVGFGSKTNACRTFMLVVALAELLDGALMLRADSVPSDTGSYLDDYGPLAGLRLAALNSPKQGPSRPLRRPSKPFSGPHAPRRPPTPPRAL